MRLSQDSYICVKETLGALLPLDYWHSEISVGCTIFFKSFIDLGEYPTSKGSYLWSRLFDLFPFSQD